MEATSFTDTVYGKFETKSDQRELAEPDVHIFTSGGLRIPAHSSILVLHSIFSNTITSVQNIFIAFFFLGIVDEE